MFINNKEKIEGAFKKKREKKAITHDISELPNSFHFSWRG